MPGAPPHSPSESSSQQNVLPVQAQPSALSSALDMLTHPPTAGATALLSLAAGGEQSATNHTSPSSSGFTCRTTAASTALVPPVSLAHAPRSSPSPMGISALLSTPAPQASAPTPSSTNPNPDALPSDGGEGGSRGLESVQAAGQAEGETVDVNVSATTPRQPASHVPPPRSATMPSSESMGTRRATKRRRAPTGISHSEKRRLCELSEENPNANHNLLSSLLRQQTGRSIERSTVSRVLQRKSVWLKAESNSHRKRLVSPRFPTVEEALSELIRHRTVASGSRLGLTDKVLMKESKEIAKVLRAEYGSLDSKSPNFVSLLESFRGSCSWVTSFKKRNMFAIPEEHKLPLNDPRRVGFAPLTPTVLDIWNTELDPRETREVLSNCPRLEDLYFLEATVLAPNALPEHAVMPPPSSASIEARTQEAAVDEALFGTQMQGFGVHTANDIESPAFGNFQFGLAVPAGVSGSSSQNANSSVHVQEDESGIGGNIFGGMGGASRGRGSAGNSSTTRHPVDEDSLIVALLCTNASGADRVAPWIVGKRPVRSEGQGNGATWKDCDARYFNNVQGWLTTRIVRNWVKEFDERAGRSIVLVTSLLSSADIEMLNLKFVTVVPLPRTPNIEDYGTMQRSVSSHSPMSLGIEDVFRAKYRCLVIDRALPYVRRGDSVQDISLRSIAKMLKEAWHKVPLALIRRAWRDTPYLPLKLHAGCAPCKSTVRSIVDKRVSELDGRIRNYRNAILTSLSPQRLGVLIQDVQVAMDDPKMYVWLQAEQPLFHPKASASAFVRSIIAVSEDGEVSSDAEASAQQEVKQCPEISNYEDALHAANRLADFTRNDDGMSGGQSLYLVSSLQLEIKKLHEQQIHNEQTQEWSPGDTSRS